MLRNAKRQRMVLRSNLLGRGGCEMPTWASILVAVLAPSGLLVTLIERTRRENNRDHNKNSDLLKRIDKKVDHVSERVDDHIEWHLTKEK